VNRTFGLSSRENTEFNFRVPFSQRYLVLGLVGLVGLGLPLLLRLGLVGLALWLVSWIALNKYRCEYGTQNSMFVEGPLLLVMTDFRTSSHSLWFGLLVASVGVRAKVWPDLGLGLELWLGIRIRWDF